METSKPKWDNSILRIMGVNSLRLECLQYTINLKLKLDIFEELKFIQKFFLKLIDILQWN